MKNKKTNKKIIAGLSITCLSALLMLSGCKIKTPSSSSSSSKEETTSSNQSSPSSSVQLKDFDDSIKFNDLTITYDGNEHQLEISNSSSVQIEYLTEYKFTNAGEYEIKARISKEGYNPKEIALISYSPCKVASLSVCISLAHALNCTCVESTQPKLIA